MKEDDLSALEMEEQQSGFFANQAESEFARIVAKKRYEMRRGKILFLRSVGRHERKRLSEKYNRPWQQTLK